MIPNAFRIIFFERWTRWKPQIFVGGNHQLNLTGSWNMDTTFMRFMVQSLIILKFSWLVM